jgi:hypothetical protein
MARKYRVISKDDGQLLSMPPYVSLRDAHHVVGMFANGRRRIEIHRYNEKTKQWEKYEPSIRRNRSGVDHMHPNYGSKNKNKTTDEEYAYQLNEWIYQSIRDNLTPSLGSTIAQSIARDAAHAAVKRYESLAKRRRT